jgi:uncharacterized RDD family membrane protein YckC
MDHQSQTPGTDRTHDSTYTSSTVDGTARSRIELPNIQVATAPKAELSKRIIAGVIDAVIGAVVGLIPVIGGIIAAGYWLVRDGLDIEFMDHRSIGKKVMKLRPVTLDGRPVDIQTSIKRNWMFALGGVVSLLLYIPIIGWLLMIPVALLALVIGIVELVLVITDAKGRRFGDKLAATQVIETSS